MSKHGLRYLDTFPQSERITLSRTKVFHLRVTDERVRFFRVCAHLLWYLLSGKSHVGHLYNHATNPIHEIVLATIVRPLIYRVIIFKHRDWRWLPSLRCEEGRIRRIRMICLCRLILMRTRTEWIFQWRWESRNFAFEVGKLLDCVLGWTGMFGCYFYHCIINHIGPWLKDPGTECCCGRDAVWGNWVREM